MSMLLSRSVPPLPSSIVSTSLFSTKFISWRRLWHPTPVLLPGKSHGWRSLVGCSPWGHEESDTTEWLHFHFSLSCVGEGNGNPLQYSCLENPRDRGAWWATVYGVAQSWTWLKRLSSSSSRFISIIFLDSIPVASSVTQLCLTLCDPMDCSMPGFPVHHQLLDPPQTHVHQVSDAIQPSHPLSSPSPPAPNPSQHQGLFQWVSSSHQMVRVLEFQLQQQMNIQDWFPLGWTDWISLQPKWLSRAFSNTTVQKHQFFGVQLS